MKLALVQFNPTVADFDGNCRRILDLATEAKSRGADLAVFSELRVCGYPPQDLLERPAFIERNRSALAFLIREISLPCLVGYVGKAQDNTGKPIANCAALIANGQLLLEQRKMLLPTYDVFDESRYFQPATTQQIIALGDQRLGVTICEDVWNDKNFWAQRLYERDPVSELASRGSTVLLNISASPYTMHKRELRFGMLRALAAQHHVPVVYVNQVGGNDSLVFDGSSVVMNPKGEIAALARWFDEDMVLFDTQNGVGEIRSQPSDEIEGAFRALVSGTRDYVRKCGFQKVVVGSAVESIRLLWLPSQQPLSARRMLQESPCLALIHQRAASTMRADSRITLASSWKSSASRTSGIVIVTCLPTPFGVGPKMSPRRICRPAFEATC